MMVFSLQVDNVKTYLPMTVDEGLAQVYQSGINIVCGNKLWIETDIRYYFHGKNRDPIHF